MSRDDTDARFFMLTREQLTQYEADGYTVVPDHLTPEQISAMKVRANAIIDEWDEDSPGHFFSTNDNDRTGDEYFLESAEMVRCFFEEEAFGPDGKLVQDRR